MPHPTVESGRAGREVTHEHVEDLLGDRFADPVEFHVLQDELSIHHEREQLSQGEQEVNVGGLGSFGGRGLEHRAEGVDLATENVHIWGVEPIERHGPVVKADLAQSTRRRLMKQVVVIDGVWRTGTSGYSCGTKKEFAMNFRIGAMFTSTVPSSLGNARMWHAATFPLE